ncbi:MAG: hypothetical protein AAB229_02360 [Candidatus Hydrogenedentota bacterium]
METEEVQEESPGSGRMFHDVNNSLSSIGMNIQYLTEGGGLSGEMLDVAREIKEEVEALHRRMKAIRLAVA